MTDVDVDGADNIDEVTSHELVDGTSIEYATYHQTGTQFIPARPVIGMSTTTMNQLTIRIADATAAATAPKPSPHCRRSSPACNVPAIRSCRSPPLPACATIR